jgi:hypothetical protein
MKILVLTSSLLDDRKLLYSDFINLCQDNEVHVWSTSFENERYREGWENSGAKIFPFPK